MNKVRVYWNLHKKLWSVQDRKTGLVIAHTDHIALTDAKFVVRKAGQEKVRREGKKNVHAFVRGDCPFYRLNPRNATLDTLTYNPYKYASFVDKQTEEPVYKASRAWLSVTDKIPTIQAEGVQYA